MGVTNSVVEPNQEQVERDEVKSGEKKLGNLQTNFRPSIMPFRKATEFDSMASDLFPRISSQHHSYRKGLELDSALGKVGQLRQTSSK